MAAFPPTLQPRDPILGPLLIHHPDPHHPILPLDHHLDLLQAHRRRIADIMTVAHIILRTSPISPASLTSPINQGNLAMGIMDITARAIMARVATDMEVMEKVDRKKVDRTREADMIGDVLYRPEDRLWMPLPYYMREGLDLWIRVGKLPGDFLLSVLCNDYMAAAQHADDMNRMALWHYAAFLHNAAPIGSYGSETKCKIWTSHRGLEGRDKFYEMHPGGSQDNVSGDAQQ